MQMRGDHVALEPLRDEDSPRLFEWINDRELVLLSAPFEPVARPDHDAWFERIRRSEDVEIFGIRLLDGDELIGSCQLKEIDRAEGVAELQIRIGAEGERGRGLGTEAVGLLLDHAFDDLGLQRVGLEVFPSNERGDPVLREGRVPPRGRAPPGGVDRWRADRRDRHGRVARRAERLPWLKLRSRSTSPTSSPGWATSTRSPAPTSSSCSTTSSSQSRAGRTASSVLMDGEPGWVTAPVRRDGKVSIAETRFDESKPWRKKVLKTMYFSYRRAPHFERVYPRIEDLVQTAEERVGPYNESAIRALCEGLNLTGTRLVRSSDLGVEATSTERLVGIVAELGGSAYLSGGGAGGYQEDEAFDRAGIELLHQDFGHPVYPQASAEPAMGLSVIDALMSCGFEGTAELLGGETGYEGPR